jgi:hypothetical protein
MRDHYAVEGVEKGKIKNRRETSSVPVVAYANVAMIVCGYGGRKGICN